MAKLSFYTKEMAELCESYIKKGYWQKKSFVDHWEQNAQLYPDKESLVDSRMRLTWSKVKQLVDRVALSFLKLGLKKDESVAVLLPWCVEFCLIRAAHEKAGIILIQLAPTLRHEELEHILRVTGAKMVIIPWRYRDFDYFNMIEEIRPNLPYLKYILIAGDEVPERAISLKEMLNHPLEEEFHPDYLSSNRHSPFEMSFLLHTTGTTGLPKLVGSTQAAHEWVGRVHQSETGDKLTTNDVCGIICPAITGPNMLPFYSASMVGAKIVLMEVFRPEEALQLIERERITVFSAVPAQLGMMAKHPDFEKYDLSSLRFIVCAGASLAYQMALEAEEKFGCPIVQHYGSQENGVVTVLQHYSEPQDQRLLTVGRPSIANEVKIVDESGMEVPQGQVGEIMARGPCCDFGYYKDPEASMKAWTNDGWYLMGDLGKFDEKGNIVLVGRAKDMIIRGGQNISPLEIENLLLTHPKVLDVAIVGMPDPIMGEKACAYIVPKTGQEFKFDEMVLFLKEKKIAIYKLPERLEIVGKLPTVAGQKIDKKALLQDIAQKLKAVKILSGNVL